MAFDYDLWPAKTQIAPASSTKFGAVHIPITAAITTTMLVLNKITRITRVPKGFVLTSCALLIPDMDSSTGVVFDIGDSGLSGRLFSAKTTAQASGYLTFADLATAAINYEFTANTDILFKTTTAPTGTAAAGTIKGFLSGYVK